MTDEKPKKIQKMFDALQIQLTGRVNVMHSNMTTWQSNINKELEAFMKKYNEMHGLLLRKFLVELESRVRLAEINSISMVKLYVMKFYEMEKKNNPDFNMTYEEYYTQLSNDLIAVSGQVTKELEKEDAASMEQEKETNP